MTVEDKCLTKDCLRCVHRDEHPASRALDCCGVDANHRNVGEYASTAPTWCPVCQPDKPDMLDITAPKVVEVQVRFDQKVVWVNVDGKCALRCCQVGHVVMPDNTDCDGTDNAHPAWWRGHVNGIIGLTAKLQAIVDGKDDGAGVVVSPAVEKLRRDIIRLRAMAKGVE